MKTALRITLLLLCFMLAGCAALGTRSGWNTGPHAPSPAFYSGTVRNAKRATKIIPKENDPNSGPVSTLVNILEMPISLVFDTIFIPNDIGWLISGEKYHYLDE
ncbi:hypothetical protein BVY04_04525 [bacterium M21]|nr:hypothetical protein BVY04_04525 [bacterium M21]